MKKLLSLLLIPVAVAFTSAPQVMAQKAIGSSIEGSLSIKRLGGVGVDSVGRLISALFNVALLVAAIFVFGMLILGGYGWLTAGGDKSKVEEARTRITNALIGLAIVASAWALINIVAQFFGVDINNIQLPSATGSNVGESGQGGL